MYFHSLFSNIYDLSRCSQTLRLQSKIYCNFLLRTTPKWNIWRPTLLVDLPEFNWNVGCVGTARESNIVNIYLLNKYVYANLILSPAKIFVKRSYFSSSLLWVPEVHPVEEKKIFLCLVNKASRKKAAFESNVLYILKSWKISIMKEDRCILLTKFL